MLSKLIIDNYALKINRLTLLDSHFGTEIFLLEASNKKFIVKTLPLYMEGVENEGDIIEYLLRHDIRAARLLKTRNGKYYVKADNF